MEEKKLYFVPETISHGQDVLFEGSESRSIADKEQDADYWITYTPKTICQKSFQLEVTTFKKALGEEFLGEFIKLVEKHSAVKKS